MNLNAGLNTPIHGVKTFLFLLIHVILGLLMYHWKEAATFHAYATLSVGAFIALTSRRPERIAYAGAYIVGAEVLWRMTEAKIFWEFGKYALSLVFLIAVLKRGVKRPVLPILYLLLLAPAVYITMRSEISFQDVRQAVSFNLSGPAVLTLSVLFFSKLKLTPPQVHRVFFAMAAPVLSIAAIAGFTTYTAEKIVFTANSMFVTSGGFGPNQVSSMLGLGAFLVFFYLLDARRGVFFKFFLYLVGIFMIVQAILTFSRGGVYCAVSASILASLYLARNRRVFIRYLTMIVMITVTVLYLLLPWLTQFTGGAVLRRYQDTTLTGRETIVADDIRIWRKHFVFGVGAGMSPYYHRIPRLKKVSAHTEFSRLLAEHGLFGLVAILVLMVMAFNFFRRAQTSREKALVLSAVGWTFLYMVVNAMRLAAPSFMFGLGALLLIPEGVAIVRVSPDPHRRGGTVKPVPEEPKPQGKPF